MPQEIERKFVVITDEWTKNCSEGESCVQGYLSLDPDRTVRVRIKGDKGFITVKGKANGISCPEIEEPISVEKAREMLQLCLTPYIEKVRYEVMHEGMKWEIDVFRGENAGLVIAEVELESVEQEILIPAWVGKEVSSDFRFKNASLVLQPFSTFHYLFKREIMTLSQSVLNSLNNGVEPQATQEADIETASAFKRMSDIRPTDGEMVEFVTQDVIVPDLVMQGEHFRGRVYCPRCDGWISHHVPTWWRKCTLGSPSKPGKNYPEINSAFLDGRITAKNIGFVREFTMPACPYTTCKEVIYWLKGVQEGLQGG